MVGPEKKIKEHIIAYFDILGYKSNLESEDVDHMDFLKEILGIKETIKLAVNASNSVFLDKIKVRVYSDNFLLYVESEKENDTVILSILLHLISQIQLVILGNYQMLIRGAITKGLLYVDEEIVFGSGIVNVVQLESQARYPRIIVDNVKLKKCINNAVVREFLFNDIDKALTLNCFTYFNAKNFGMSEVKESIIFLTKKYCKYPANYTLENTIQERENLIKKYLWLIQKFNNFCSDFGEKYNEEHDYDISPIDFELILNERLLKMEIKVK